jgi:hypothetical protein
MINFTKSLLITLSFLVSLQAIAQKTRSCGAHTLSHELMQKDTSYARKVNQNNELAKRKLSNARMNITYTIPVVVHVVYNTPEQNISDEQIASQIKVLNEDYSLNNANFASTPNAFKALAGNANIQFVLAKRDPNGNPTNGITRTSTSTVSYGNTDDMKYTSKGGKDGWDASKYLNIWVCKLNGVLGFAYFPGASPKIDGVVIAYDCFGTIGTAAPPFHLGRTATHEVGHYLDLRHIWGDESDCTGDDLVNDTPIHKDANYECRTFPYKICPLTTSNGEMYVNYMDYTPDDCMTMFSQGQVNRMLSALTNERASLLTSDGGTPFNFKNDAAILKLISPTASENACGSITPIAALTNLGTDTLKSVDIVMYLNSQLVATKKWTGALAPLANTQVTLDNLTFSNSSNNLVIYTASPNNTNDENKTNDTVKTTVVNIVNTNLPLFESFESGNFPPANWGISNPNNNITWEQSNAASYVGTKSLVFKNFNADSDINGQHDEIISPKFKAHANANLSFYYAYKVYSDPFVASDTLTISVSTDCGKTKNVIFKKGGQELVVTSPSFTTLFYIPSNQSEWKKITLPLTAYANQNITLYFDNRTEYENNLYIDSIYVNADSVLGLNEPESNESVRIYPNPSSGKVNIQMRGGYDHLTCFNLFGNPVKELENTDNEISTLDLSTLNKGVYLINIIKGGQSFWQKIVVQ